MECEEITQVPVALAIMQTPRDKRLEKLFNCIYALFQGSFLNWILNKYSSQNRLKEKLLEDAKDSFQEGLLALYRKAKQNELNIKGTLKTTLYSFCFLQLLASFKKDRYVYGAGIFMDCLTRDFDDEFSESERQALFNERENDLIEALSKLPEKQRDILLMKFFPKLKSKQIAELLKVTPGNIDNDSAKAYKKLREILMTKFGFQGQKWN